MKKVAVIGLILGLVLLLILAIRVMNKKSEKMADADMVSSDNRVRDEMDDKLVVSSTLASSHLPDNPNIYANFDLNNLKDIYLAGGCFWGLEAYMTRVYGVYEVTAGYANGTTENPSYEDLIYKGTGHAETVHVQYDPALVSLDTLLTYYFKVVDPTSLNKQGNDRGVQYRSGIYYTNPQDLDIIMRKIEKEQMAYVDTIVVESLPLVNYYLAEDYHQDYLEKNPNGYCHIDLDRVEESIGVYTKPSMAVIQEKLSKLQFKVTQNGGTESPFDNAYWDNKAKGLYVDIVTGEPLFSSKDKYQSGTGWPSFTQPIALDVIEVVEDKKLFVTRTEVKSVVGDSHLGHVFEDGPLDRGGLRYCLNSAALKFIPLEDMDSMGYGALKHLVE